MPKRTDLPHCDMKLTLRYEGAALRDAHGCPATAEFVVLYKGDLDGARNTCAQHLSKAVRTVLAAPAVPDDASAIIGQLRKLP